MESDRMHTTDELHLGELLAQLWDSKFLIAGCTTAALILGGAGYLLQPRVYEAKASVFPLRQTQFSSYLGLSQERELEGSKKIAGDEKKEGGAFPYTPTTLFSEFLAHLTDTGRLMAIATETGVVERGTLSDEEYNQAVGRFVSGIKFEIPTAQEIGAGQSFLNFRARAGNPDKIATFVRHALTSANTDMANDLEQEVRMRTDEIQDHLEARMMRLKLDIEARRLRTETERKDDIARITEQSAIAHSLGIEKPLDLRAIEAVEQGNAATAQINSSGGQPQYLQGYAALDERIKMLQERTDHEPFTHELRQLEQQLYIVKNDPRPSQILALLARSPLGNPATAMMARFSVASVHAEKVAPRAIFFGVGSLLLGLLVGSAAALVRQRKPGRA
jgi:chain length determinant protein (polysaccharide antigen chain regulator)